MDSRIVPYLYAYDSIPKIIDAYVTDLRSTEKENDNDNDNDILHANKLLAYKNIIVDKTFLSDIKETFYGLYNMIEQNFDDLRFVMEGRRKSLISTEKKISMYLETNKPLDTLRDLFAFRIILLADESIELVKSCYDLMNKIIKFYIRQGFIPCESTQVYDHDGFDQSRFEGMIVPNSSLITKEYQDNVKDYILNPKRNGYQSLHVVFRDSVGRCFEVQVRTLQMHLHTQGKDANHEDYKAQRYEELEFDRDRIKIPGYKVYENMVFDYVGLERPLQILQRQKTF